MKKLITIVISLFIFSSCLVTRSITEEYIKNNIENHEVGKPSSIKTYTIFKGYSKDMSSYLELTGFKQGDEKKLIIGVDKYYKLRPKFNGEQAVKAKIYYLVLNENEFKLMNREIQNLESRYTQLMAERNEEAYVDFTIKEDFFISGRKAKGLPPKLMLLDLWINGKKYTIDMYTIKKKLPLFQSWNP